jgi:hypothetical protein
MSSRRRHPNPHLIVACAVGCLWLAPRHAQAQWYVVGFSGANTTGKATVVVDQPSRDTHLEFRDVPFESQSFKSPQYYGYRIGHMFGARGRWGLEFEFVHPKVFSRTAAAVNIRGRFRGSAVDATAPMSVFAERYAMSHGLNLVLVNLAVQIPIGRPSPGRDTLAAVVLRAGVGPTVPHAETTIAGESLDGYEISNVAVQGAAGVRIRVYGRLGAVLDYQMARARPVITLVDGTGQTTAHVHQIAAGVSIRLSR